MKATPMRSTTDPASNKTFRSSGRRLAQHRTGAITVLMALVLPFLVLLAAFAINVAYMQLIREQLHVTSDSAAKAALVNLRRDPKHELRRHLRPDSGQQQQGGRPDNHDSIRQFCLGQRHQRHAGFVCVHSRQHSHERRQSDRPRPRSPTSWRRFCRRPVSTVSESSLTTRISHDVILVLDRSASMAFDTSASEFHLSDGCFRGRHGAAVLFHSAQCYVEPLGGV